MALIGLAGRTRAAAPTTPAATTPGTNTPHTAVDRAHDVGYVAPMSRIALLAATLLLGACAVSTGDERSVDTSASQAEQNLTDSTGCHYKCEKCPPNQVCSMLCVAIGSCKQHCVQTQLCIIGYQWDS